MNEGILRENEEVNKSSGFVDSLPLILSLFNQNYMILSIWTVITRMNEFCNLFHHLYKSVYRLINNSLSTISISISLRIYACDRPTILHSQKVVNYGEQFIRNIWTIFLVYLFLLILFFLIKIRRISTFLFLFSGYLKQIMHVKEHFFLG